MEEKYTSLFGVTEEEAKADMPAPRGVRHPRLMTGLVWARYLLPPLAALTLLVHGNLHRHQSRTRLWKQSRRCMPHSHSNRSRTSWMN